MSLPPSTGHSSFVENVQTVNIVSGPASELRLEQDDILFLRGLQHAFATLSNANAGSDLSDPNKFNQAKHDDITGQMQNRPAATKNPEDDNEDGEISYARSEENPSKANLDIYKEFRRRANSYTYKGATRF